MYGLAACYAYSFGVEVRPRQRPARPACFARHLSPHRRPARPPRSARAPSLLIDTAAWRSSDAAARSERACGCAHGRASGQPRRRLSARAPGRAQLALDNALAPYFSTNFNMKLTDAGNLAATFGMLSARPGPCGAERALACTRLALLACTLPKAAVRGPLRRVSCCVPRCD